MSVNFKSGFLNFAPVEAKLTKGERIMRFKDGFHHSNQDGM